MTRTATLFCLIFTLTVPGLSACQRAGEGRPSSSAPVADARATMAPPQQARRRANPPRRDRALVPAPTRPAPRSASALDLPDAPGVTRLTATTATAAPLVSLPTARVVAAARAHCRTHWYGLYLQGKKLGWAEMGCAVTRWKGREVVERRSRMVMEAKMYAATVKIEIATAARFAAVGRGELLSYTYSQDGMQQRKTVTVTRSPAGWEVEQTYRAGAIQKPPSRKTLPTLRSTLGNGEMAVTTLLLEGKLTPGARYRFVELDPEDVVERESAAQLLASGQRVLQGVPVRLHKLEVLELYRKLHGITLVDASGNWLDGRLQGTIRIRREEKAMAKRVDPKAGDFGLGAVIKAPLDVKAPRQVRQLKLRLEGYLPTSLAASKRHLVTPLGPRQVELTITRESLDGLPTTLLPQRADRFPKALAATEQIEANHPEIRRLARQALGGERHALAAARKLTTFVYGFLRKSLSTNLDSALAIARAKVGDCTEHARLLVALCRAVGLPAREVGGVTWVPDLGGFGYHAWAEVWVGRWVSADPSWNELPVNATHITMGGPEDVQWIGTLGNLKATVLSFAKDPDVPPTK